MTFISVFLNKCLKQCILILICIFFIYVFITHECILWWGILLFHINALWGNCITRSLFIVNSCSIRCEPWTRLEHPITSIQVRKSAVSELRTANPICVPESKRTAFLATMASLTFLSFLLMTTICKYKAEKCKKFRLMKQWKMLYKQIVHVMHQASKFLVCGSQSLESQRVWGEILNRWKKNAPRYV